MPQAPSCPRPTSSGVRGRRGDRDAGGAPPLSFLLVPIVYVPLTICFVLTNMRYTITMQPLMFVFVAVALSAALRLDSPESER